MSDYFPDDNLATAVAQAADPTLDGNSPVAMGGFGRYQKTRGTGSRDCRSDRNALSEECEDSLAG